MKIAALQCPEVYLVGCTIDANQMVAEIMWVNAWGNPQKLKRLAGESLFFVEPKQIKGPKIMAKLPKEIDLIYTQVTLEIIKNEHRKDDETTAMES